MEKKYLSCAETAKLVRKALKESFPGVKFSVRSSTYSGGASIRVGWLDGPTSKEVDAVVQMFSGADFDGMIDMKSYRRHWLTPQGEVFYGGTPGTEGSRGTIPADNRIKPHDDAIPVSMGADFIFTERSYSRKMLERAADWAEKTWGERPEVVDRGSYAYLNAPPSEPYKFDGGCNTTVAEVANQEMSEQPGPRWSDRVKEVV